MSVNYQYSVSSFPNNKVYEPTLTDEIRASSITIALDYIYTDSGTVNIYFKAALSGAEQITLNSIVAAHQGVPVNTSSTLTTAAGVPLEVSASSLVNSSTSGLIFAGVDATNRARYISVFPDGVLKTVNVSGSITTSSVFVSNFPSTQTITVTSSLPVTVGNQIFVTSTGSLLVTGSVLSLPSGIQSITGSLAIDNVVRITSTGSILTTVSNFPSIQLVSVTSSLPVTVGNQVTVTSTGSLPVVITNVPTVTGSVTVAGPVTVANFPATQIVTVTSSLPVTVGNQVTITSTGSVGIAGTVFVSNFPTTQLVSITSSLPVTVGNQVSITSTGSLPVTFTGTQTITGSVGITNFPTTQLVSVTSSLPVTVGNQVTVTTTGSLPVVFVGTQTITGSVGVVGTVSVSNFPATQLISVTSSLPVTGTLGIDNVVRITATGSLPVTFAGTQTVTGSVQVLNQVVVTTTGSLPVTFGGTQTVTGSVGITNFPATQSVTGSVQILNQLAVTTTGSLPVTFTGVQTVTGSLAVDNVVRVTTTGSVPVLVTGTPTITGSVGITNSVRISGVDGSGAANIATVNSATIMPSAQNNSLVVAISPNGPALAGYVNSSYTPDPNSYTTAVYSQVVVDASNKLETRATVLTDERSFKDDFSNSSLFTTLSGNVTFTSGSTLVTGVNTSFTTQTRQQIYIKPSSAPNDVLSFISYIISDTQLVLDQPYTGVTQTNVVAQVSNWDVQICSGGSVQVNTSSVSITPNLTIGTGSFIQTHGDYLPCLLTTYASLNRRDVNTTSSIGFRDSWVNPSKRAEVIFWGVDSTSVAFITANSTSSFDTQITNAVIPNNGVTTSSLKYVITLNATLASLSINDIVVAEHDLHTPGPYDSMDVFCGTQNSSLPAATTTLNVDLVALQNINLVASQNPSRAEPNSVQLVGTTPAGVRRDVYVTPSNELQVEIGGSNVSAFGDIISVNHTPIMQFDFVGTRISASLMTQTVGTYAVSGANTTNSSGRAALSTGTNVSGSAWLISNKVARYRAGQGITARFTSAFDTPFANSEQVVGMSAPSITWTNNSTAPGQPITAVDVGDGYFFGYNGTSFGILHRNSRAGSVTWIPQSTWNVDRCDGRFGALNPSGFNLKPLFGNVYMIRYPYLGYGNIKFYVQNAFTGGWVLCHVIQYTNSTKTLQIGQPSMNFYAHAKNLGNTSNLQMFLGSVGIFLTGDRIYTGPVFGFDNRIANNGNATELPVFSIRNCTSYNGEANRGMIRLRSISFSGNGAATDCRIRIRRNATLTGATFANGIFGTVTGGSNGYILTSAQSITSVDTAATAVAAVTSGATDIVFNAVAAATTGYQIDLTPYDIFCVPGDTLTFTMFSSANNNSVQVAANWSEDI